MECVENRHHSTEWKDIQEHMLHGLSEAILEDVFRFTIEFEKDYIISELVAWFMLLSFSAKGELPGNWF